MAIPDEEMIRRCEEAFGDPLDAERRSGLAGILDTLLRANLRIVDILENGAEPMGHAALLRRSRHDG